MLFGRINKSSLSRVPSEPSSDVKSVHFPTSVMSVMVPLCSFPDFFVSNFFQIFIFIFLTISGLVKLIH